MLECLWSPFFRCHRKHSKVEKESDKLRVEGTTVYWALESDLKIPALPVPSYVTRTKSSLRLSLGTKERWMKEPSWHRGPFSEKQMEKKKLILSMPNLRKVSIRLLFSKRKEPCLGTSEETGSVGLERRHTSFCLF